MADFSKNYDLLISDVDGTLMGADKVISSSVKSAVKKWKDSGRKFTIASGRQFRILKNELKDLELSDPVVVRGGAEIVDPKSEKVIYSQHIDKDIVSALLKELKSTNYNVTLEKDSYFYSTHKMDPKRYPMIAKKSLDEFSYEGAPKVNVYLGDRDIFEFERFAKELGRKFPELHIVRSYNDLGKTLDITSIKATKHLAVLELLKLLEIDHSNTVGVGDGYNDFPLLEAVGLKVAMGNANDELQEIADITVPELDRDGVADLINKLLGNSKY